MTKYPLFLLVFSFFLGILLYGQEQNDSSGPQDAETALDAPDTGLLDNAGRAKQDVWLALSAETALYTEHGFAYGGGLSLGYGTGSCMGLKAVWFMNADDIDTLEVLFLFRLYLMGQKTDKGPFLQFMGGHSLYNHRGEWGIPSTLGVVSAGLQFGWRFVIGGRFFIEPAIRGGYPYLAGAGVSFGLKKLRNEERTGNR